MKNAIENAIKTALFLADMVNNTGSIVPAKARQALVEALKELEVMK